MHVTLIAIELSESTFHRSALGEHSKPDTFMQTVDG
jgi:hypothetical protein